MIGSDIIKIFIPCSGRKLIMDSDGYPGLIIILLTAFIKGFYTVCETAVTEIDDRKIKNSDKDGKFRLLAELTSKPARLVTAFAVNRMLTAAIIVYAAAFFCLPPLTDLLKRTFYGSDAGEQNLFGVSAAAAVIILFLTVLLLTVVCDGVPKKIASGGSEKLACFCAPFVKFLLVILTPLTALSSLLIRLISALFGSGGISEQEVVTEEEIMMMVDAGNETGVIEESQREMINNVFEFDDRTVSDVMTHRTDITAVKYPSAIPEIVNIAISSGFSRIPVYEDTIDHIIGMICVKDLLCFVGSEASEDAGANGFIRDILYFPASVSCGEAFKRLTAKKMQMAVVIDEYGGTAGLITMEDIVETIVGNIQDEYDDEEEELIKISDDTYTIAGTADPEKILPEFGVTLPEDNDFDTMSGFIVELLGRIPEENENPSVTYGGMTFTVLVTEDKCITKIKATVLNETENNIQKESLENDEEEN